MRKLFFATGIMLFSLCSCTQAQEQKTTDKTEVTTDIATYKMYPTENMWTFLKLNTKTGEVWQVQWGFEYDERFTTKVSGAQAWNDEAVNGRFELYPTTNMYNFILLDRVDGDTYQVQWSMEAENRIAVPIR